MHWHLKGIVNFREVDAHVVKAEEDALRMCKMEASNDTANGDHCLALIIRDEVWPFEVHIDNASGLPKTNLTKVTRCIQRPN